MADGGAGCGRHGPEGSGQEHPALVPWVSSGHGSLRVVEVLTQWYGTPDSTAEFITF